MSINFYGELFSGATITPAITRATEQAQKVARITLKLKTPVDTGLLKSNWEVNKEGFGLRIQNRTPYAIFQEMGFRHYRSGKQIPAKRMVADTMPLVEQTFTKALTKEIGKRLAGKVIGSIENGFSYTDLTDNKGTGFRYGGFKPKRK